MITTTRAASLAAWTLAALTASVIAIASSPTQAPAGEPEPRPRRGGQEIHFNNGAEPESLDPHKVTGVPEHRIFLGILEGLTSPDPETLKPLPGVAKSWEVSADGLTYTFHINENAKWSNGDPVTAHDFEWSWKRSLSPEIASQYAYMLYPVKGAEAYNTAKAADRPARRDELGVKAIDDATLVVTLENPTAYFLSLLFHYTSFPVHRKTVETHGDAWTRAENFVGNGAYKLSEWNRRENIVLTPNEHYWDAKTCKLQRIVIYPIDNHETAYQKFLNGELDWISDIPATKIDEIKRHPDFGVSAYLGSYFYRINTTKPPLDDFNVRLALNLAVNRKELCENVTKAGEIPAEGYVPPGIPGYDGVSVLSYDPVRAKKLLADAGYPDGKGFPEITLLYNTHESHKKVAEVVQQMWRETLGIKVALENTEWKVYLDRTDEKDYWIVRAGWIGDYLDPMTFLDMWVKDGGNNNTGWSHPRYDELVGLAMAETDSAKRTKLLLELETLLCEKGLPIVPVYYYVNKWMISPEIQGVHPNILDTHPWKYVYVEEE